MTSSLPDIDTLIAKSISANISSEEEITLEKWKSASKSNLALYNKTKRSWEKATKYISATILEEDRVKIQNEIIRKLHVQLGKSKRINLLYKVAAAIAIPLTFALSWYLLNTTLMPNNSQVTEVSSPKGNISKCVLPDGTEVWINTSSKITYNTNSFNRKAREVNLSGEAYFQVTNNKEKPFKVQTHWGTIKVSGTAFNAKSYPDSKLFETVLTEGSVTLNFSSNNQQPIHLSPGEKVLYNANTNSFNISKVDTEIYSSWRNEQIIFKDATLNDLINELERIYDIKFILTDPLIGKYRFRGMFSYDNNLIDALEKIKKTAQLNYQIENKEVRLTKNTN